MISEDHDYIDITGRKYRYRLQRAGKNRIRVTCTMGEEPAAPSEILTPGAAEAFHHRRIFLRIKEPSAFRTGA